VFAARFDPLHSFYTVPIRVVGVQRNTELFRVVRPARSAACSFYSRSKSGSGQDRSK